MIPVYCGGKQKPGSFTSSREGRRRACSARGGQGPSELRCKLGRCARVARRVPKALFDGLPWPPLTTLHRETIEKTLCGSLLPWIKSPLLYQLS